MAGEVLAGLPQALEDRALHGAAQRLGARGAAPGVLLRRGRRGRAHVLELLLGPRELAVGLEARDQGLAQRDEQLDVERRVGEHRLGQRTHRPVGGRMLLGEGDPQQLLQDRGQADARQAGHPGRELGVEQPIGAQPLLGQAGQVLAGRVQDPLDAREGLLQRGQPVEGFGIDEPDAGALALELDEHSPLAVPDPGGALRVDGDGPGPRGERRGAGLQARAGVGEPGDSTGRCGDQPRGRVRGGRLGGVGHAAPVRGGGRGPVCRRRGRAVRGRPCGRPRRARAADRRTRRSCPTTPRDASRGPAGPGSTRRAARCRWCPGPH